MIHIHIVSNTFIKNKYFGFILPRIPVYTKLEVCSLGRVLPGDTRPEFTESFLNFPTKRLSARSEINHFSSDGHANLDHTGISIKHITTLSREGG